MGAHRPARGAAEALAAIGGEGVAEVLTNTARTQSQRCGGHLIFTQYLHLYLHLRIYFQVRETCLLALVMMEFRRDNKNSSLDPVPASTQKSDLLINLSQFER